MANNNYYVCGEEEEEFDNQISCEKKLIFSWNSWNEENQRKSRSEEFFL